MPAWKLALPGMLVLIPFLGFNNHRNAKGFEETRVHECVNYDKNQIKNADRLIYFHYKLDKFVKKREGKITIVHIGDSHIQADYLTQETRVLMQKTFGNGGRGFVFPYRVIGSNGAPNFKVSALGSWSGCRSVMMASECNFGITGASATTYDSSARLYLNPNRLGDMNYEFDRVKMFYNRSPRAMQMTFMDGDSNNVEVDEQPISHSVSEVYLPAYYDSISMGFAPGMDRGFYQLFGMSFENDHPGVVYHSIGLNGAYVKSYLRNQFFIEQLKALKPDLVIISLGTNDGYMPDSRFCSNCFSDGYRKLLDRIKEASPDASLLLTTPGDYYRRRRYHNSNNDLIVDAILDISDEYDAGVWDFNRIMGGNYAVRQWYQAGLARYDLVHYTKEGYKLQGQLLFQALMNSYESRFD